MTAGRGTQGYMAKAEPLSTSPETKPRGLDFRAKSVSGETAAGPGRNLRQSPNIAASFIATPSLPSTFSLPVM
jgi:hypothetical protein